MKIIGIILGAASIISAGFYLRKKLVLNLLELDKLILETEELKRGVLIYKKPIGMIISKLTLPPFKSDFNPEENKNEAFSLVYDMLAQIKKSVESNADGLIEDRIERLKQLRNEAENELKTKGVMFIKAACLLALLFVVIII